MKTRCQRAEEKRAEKLERVRDKVQSGSLAIGPMTEHERRRDPPVVAPSQRPGRW